MTISQSNNSSEVPLVTFNSLYNILREERKIKTPQNLPEKFYEAIAIFLRTKEEEVKKLKEAKDMEKLKRENHILKNSKKIVDELLNLRLVKIANIGIKNSIFSYDLLEEDNVLEEERKFLEDVNSSTKRIRRNIGK